MLHGTPTPTPPAPIPAPSGRGSAGRASLVGWLALWRDLGSALGVGASGRKTSPSQANNDPIPVTIQHYEAGFGLPFHLAGDRDGVSFQDWRETRMGG